MNFVPIYNETQNHKKSRVYKTIKETQRLLKSILYLARKIFML